MMHDKKAKPAKKMMAGGMTKKMMAGGMAKKGYQAGGMMNEGEMMDRMGRGMAKADMQQRAMKEGGIAKAIKKHEKSSVAHKAGLKAGGMAKMMASGGMTKKMASGGGVKRADGVVSKGHTKGKMI